MVTLLDQLFLVVSRYVEVHLSFKVLCVWNIVYVTLRYSLLHTSYLPFTYRLVKSLKELRFITKESYVLLLRTIPSTGTVSLQLRIFCYFTDDVKFLCSQIN